MRIRPFLFALILTGSWCELFGQLPGESYRFPAVEPDKAVATFAVQHGFSLQLVAHEPLVSDPVDGCFDARGRLFVAEMHGYPYSEEIREQQPEPLGKKDAGIIRRLVDADHDGIFESSTVYAQGISWVTSVACWQDGLFVLAPSKLYYFRDANDDGIAEEREIVLEGFSRANVQGLANNMKWGLDGRLYIAGGTNGGSLKQGDREIGSLNRKDLAFNPRNREVEFVSGGRQFGHSFNDWGDRFDCSNSNHIQQVLFPEAAIERGTINVVGDPVISIAKEGPAAPVFRTSPAEPWRVERTARRAADPAYRNRLPMTELVPTGFFTSATGVTLFRGDAYPPEFSGNAFIGDVGGNLIHRKLMQQSGPRWLASRADEDVEFITSTDTWFRPVNFVNGPDGCLYILDMYRETIEHPVSIPEDIKAKVDLQSGSDRGRVYRLVPPSGRGHQWVSLAERTSDELVDMLAHPNAWQRETAARLLLERQDRTIMEKLRDAAKTFLSPMGRMHALHVLRNLALIREADVQSALSDPDPHVLATAIDLAQPFLSSPDSALRKPLLKAAGHPDLLVRFRLALMLTGVPEKFRDDLWAALAQSSGSNPDVRAALLLAVPRQPVQLTLRSLTAQDALAEMRSPLLQYLGRSGEDGSVRKILAAICQEDIPRKSLALSELALGLKSRKQSLNDYLGTDPQLAAEWKSLTAAAAVSALDGKLSTAARSEGLQLLAFAPDETSLPVYEQLLGSSLDPQLAEAVVASASQHSGSAALDLLERHVTTATPLLRGHLVAAILGMSGGPARVLDLVSKEQIAANDLQPAQREQLRQHPDAHIRDLFAAIPQFQVNSDRKAIIQQYADAATLTGDIERAKPLYVKHCSICHKLGDLGQAVGPEFKSVKNKSADDLLIAILDPNREAQPNYVGYTLLLNDGRTMTGLVISDTAAGILLRQPEGKEALVTREEIEQLKSTGMSLMPVGMEKVLSAQDIADLIALIRQ